MVFLLKKPKLIQDSAFSSSSEERRETLHDCGDIGKGTALVLWYRERSGSGSGLQGQQVIALRRLSWIGHPEWAVQNRESGGQGCLTLIPL